MLALGPRRRPLTRVVAALTLAAFTVSSSSCAAYRWRPIPVTDLSMADEHLTGRDVRFQTEGGVVDMSVGAIAFPYVSGLARGGDGLVQVDVSLARAVHVVTLTDKNRITAMTPVSIADIQRDPASVVGKNLMVTTEVGTVIVRDVQRTEWPWAEGRLARTGRAAADPLVRAGVVRVDLRRVRALEVRELDGGMTLVKTVGITAAVIGVAVLIVAATKESCPFVYVDRGQGWELVGEAYAGAAFRSTQRSDLLPLPDVGDARTLRIRLRNEARETQYTDRAELMIVDHPRDVRAVSTFDGRPILVGAARSPGSARDGRGRDVTTLVTARDGRLWETDPSAVAAVASDDFLQEQLTAEFEVPPGGRPVLELTGGNTAWLDLVFGRFFAAMGPRLAGYLAQGNDSAAGPRIRRWREREGVDLVVEMRTGDAWRQVAVVPTVGPIALRDVAIPLPIDPAAAPRSVAVRVRGGLGFWRIDRLALSSQDGAVPTAQRVQPRSAAATGGRDELQAILATDGRYNALSEMNESLELDFELPPRVDGRSRSTFLFSSGYYNVHQPVQSQWLPGTLKTIRDEPGSLSRFGRDLARKYVKAQGPARVSAGTGRDGL